MKPRPTAERYPESSPVSPCSILGTTHTLKKCSQTQASSHNSINKLVLLCPKKVYQIFSILLMMNLHQVTQRHKRPKRGLLQSNQFWAEGLYWTRRSIMAQEAQNGPETQKWSKKPKVAQKTQRGPENPIGPTGIFWSPGGLRSGWLLLVVVVLLMVSDT